jgi:alkylated DNA repair dioxygenase AlkB
MSNTKIINDFLPQNLYLKLNSWLLNLDLFSGITRKGNNIHRKQKWFHIDGERFDTSWKQHFDRWKGHKFPDILKEILDYVNSNLKIDTNSCLINYYENGNDFIPIHIDSITSFGPTPTIINISIGATRVIRVDKQDYYLYNNSLFVMTGPSVEHELLKDLKCNQPRWSLTFRKKLKKNYNN